MVGLLRGIGCSICRGTWKLLWFSTILTTRLMILCGLVLMRLCIGPRLLTADVLVVLVVSTSTARVLRAMLVIMPLLVVCWVLLSKWSSLSPWLLRRACSSLLSGLEACMILIMVIVVVVWSTSLEKWTTLCQQLARRKNGHVMQD